jgi:hypothetical protein
LIGEDLPVAYATGSLPPRDELPLINVQTALNDQNRPDQIIFRASSTNLARPFSVRGWSSRPRMGLSWQVTTWAPASMQSMMWRVWRMDASSLPTKGETYLAPALAANTACPALKTSVQFVGMFFAERAFMALIPSAVQGIFTTMFLWTEASSAASASIPSRSVVDGSCTIDRRRPPSCLRNRVPPSAGRASPYQCAGCLK